MKDEYGFEVSDTPFNWYKHTGLPDPNNPEEMLDARIKRTREAKALEEDKLWEEVAKHITFDASVAMVEDSDLNESGLIPQCISNPSDIKIGFRNA